MRVSNHAVNRFLERGRLFLHQHEVENPRGAILNLIKNGSKNVRLEMCPFYKNKLGCSQIINGRFKFLIRDNTVITTVIIKGDFESNWRF